MQVCGGRSERSGGRKERKRKRGRKRERERDCVLTVPFEMDLGKSFSPAKIHTQPGIKRAETYQQVLNALPQSLDQIHIILDSFFPYSSVQLIPPAFTGLIS